MDAQKFVVTFTDLDGQKRERTFADRHSAVRFLNVVVLDYGYHDGKLILRGGTFSNAPRFKAQS